MSIVTFPGVTLTQLRRRLVQLERKVRAASERRRLLPAGSSRARVTTLNARWSTACEARDRVLREIAALSAACTVCGVEGPHDECRRERS